MVTTQLNFTLTSHNCKTVQLFGSWDNYSGQPPLSKDTKKSGGWMGCFEFQGTTLKPGQRYWYYYIIDGYRVSHDPAHDNTTERTTGCKLNILDIPGKPKSSSNAISTAKQYRRVSTASIPRGRSLSLSKIVAPRPERPHQTHQVINTQYEKATLEALTSAIVFADESEDEFDYKSSHVTSLASRSTNSSSPSSVSSSSSCCTCERFGITRSGDRVKLDCEGVRCGYSGSPECSSDEFDYKSSSSCCTCERFGITRDGDRVKLDCEGVRCGYSGSPECYSDDEA
jgi:hypothetical protein